MGRGSALMEQDEREKGLEQETEREEKPPRGTAVYMLLHDFVYTFAFVTLLFVFAIRLVGVDGDSMYPTLHHADYLCLLTNIFYHDVEPGDVIVLTVREGEFAGEPIVKRVIATGGQTVDLDFDEGIVYVDGVAQDEPYINEPTYLSYNEVGLGLQYPLTVDEDCLFVMGDNRNNSADSRYAPLGLVDEREVLGKALCVVFPGVGSRNGYADCEKRDFRRIGAIS